MAEHRPALSSSAPSARGAVENLVQEIQRRSWSAAYNSLANKSEFTQADFERDLTGSRGDLRTYASLAGFDLSPLHSTSDQAQFKVNLRWASVVGTFRDVRNLQVLRLGEAWRVAWPLVKEATLPAQVIPVNYLRWDVIYRGAQDDWGQQDVESPHV